MNREAEAMVEIWTDGSCPVPHGPGGFAAILLDGERRKVVDGAFLRMTSPRAELWAVIIGLEALRRPVQGEVVSDCKYVTDAWNENWWAGWDRRGWKGVKNPDLLRRIRALAAPHALTWRHVRGHRGIALNEEADTLARTAWESRLGSLVEDPGYTPPKADRTIRG